MSSSPKITDEIPTTRNKPSTASDQSGDEQTDLEAEKIPLEHLSDENRGGGDEGEEAKFDKEVIGEAGEEHVDVASKVNPGAEQDTEEENEDEEYEEAEEEYEEAEEEKYEEAEEEKYEEAEEGKHEEAEEEKYEKAEEKYEKAEEEYEEAEEETEKVEKEIEEFEEETEEVEEQTEEAEGTNEVEEASEIIEVVRPRIPARPGVCARFAMPRFDPTSDVFLMVRRKKTTIFIDAKEDTTILELKRMIAGITKVSPEDQKLFREMNELDEKKKISDYGLNAGTAKPQLPATIALIFKDENGEWEGVDIAPLSQPPELPEVMRQQEPNNADAA